MSQDVFKSFWDYDCEGGDETHNDFDDENQIEIAHMYKIIKQNPFLNRREIISLFEDPQNEKFYDQKTHDLARDVYETMYDKNACVIIGRILSDHGGLECMQAAFYAVSMHVADATILQSYWNGIGMWVF